MYNKKEIKKIKRRFKELINCERLGKTIKCYKYSTIREISCPFVRNTEDEGLFCGFICEKLLNNPIYYMKYGETYKNQTLIKPNMLYYRKAKKGDYKKSGDLVNIAKFEKETHIDEDWFVFSKKKNRNKIKFDELKYYLVRRRHD